MNTIALGLILASWFGFANPVIHIPVFSLLLPAGLCLLSIHSISFASAFKKGFLGGSLLFGAALYWIAIPVHDYGSLPWIIALPCPMVLGCYMGLFTGSFCGLIHWAQKSIDWRLTSIFAASLWATLELTRGFFLTGFPWLIQASAFSPWPWAIQGVSFIGSYAWSGLTVLIPALILFGRYQAKAMMSAVALAILVLAHSIWVFSKPDTTHQSISASLIQGNINQSQKWDPAYQLDTVNRYLTLSRQESLTHRPRITIWPETAMPFFLQEDGPLSRKVFEFARQNNQTFLTGTPGYEPRGSDYHYFNRAILIGPSGGAEGYYDKEHLVPFGEYVPLKSIFPFISKLTTGIGDFSPGTQPEPLRTKELALGILICYEAIFPELAQKRVANGANLLVNISNDAWYGRSSAPNQHLDLTILRAVEQNRSILRATNTGISALIDAKGRVHSPTALFTEVSVYYSQVTLHQESTFFHRHFTLIHLTMAGLCLTLAGMGWRKNIILKQRTTDR